MFNQNIFLKSLDNRVLTDRDSNYRACSNIHIRVTGNTHIRVFLNTLVWVSKAVAINRRK